MQLYDDHLRPVWYYGKGCNEKEFEKQVTKLELFALVKAVTHFAVYLRNHKFTVVVDHQALQYLKSFQNQNRQIMTWVMQLSEFDGLMTIRYLRGKKHPADYLSRLNMSEKLDENEFTINEEKITEAFNVLTLEANAVLEKGDDVRNQRYIKQQAKRARTLHKEILDTFDMK